jgi:hypothetical protein
MHVGHGATAHAPINLLPEWAAVAWTAIFLVGAASHVRHMAHTTGQRRPWHACHVLMAIGMAFMYAPARIDPLAVPTQFWQLVFALGGMIAATWAIGGGGRVSTLIWLLTSIDLAAMLFMWSASAHANAPAVAWILAGYLLIEGLMWALDLYRRLDGLTPIISWRLLATESGATVPVAAVGASRSRSGVALLGELDISASMVAMTLGMAYMLIAMQLMG